MALVDLVQSEKGTSQRPLPLQETVKKVAVHDGNFHADDVFASAALLLLHPGAEIIRTRKDQIISETDLVLDVGLIYNPRTGRYDHHQQDCPLRKEGFLYAASGLLWNDLGELLTNSKRVALSVDYQLFRKIDFVDNGGRFKKYRSFKSLLGFRNHSLQPITISDLFSLYRHSDNLDLAFQEAVLYAKTIIQNYILSAKNYINQKKVIFEAIKVQGKNKPYLVLDNEIGSNIIAKFSPKTKFQVYSKQRNGKTTWRIKSVKYNGVERKLPREWWGKLDQEAKDASGVSDMYFCHKSGFTAGADSEEGILLLAEKAVAPRNYFEKLISLKFNN